MTSPYVPGRPARPADLSAFYPEWAAAPSGIEAERRLIEDCRAERTRIRRRRARTAFTRRVAWIWTALRQEARLRLVPVRRARASR